MDITPRQHSFFPHAPANSQMGATQGTLSTLTSQSLAVKNFLKLGIIAGGRGSICLYILSA
jgi:hypothetical protein